VIRYRLEVVGGPYDGTPGLYWHSEDDEPPEGILMGVCPGDGQCGTEQCVRIGRQHPSFWVTMEDYRPPNAMPYVRQDFYRESGTRDRGQAIYAVGGLLDPRSWTAAATVPAGAEEAVPTPKPSPLVTALGARPPWAARSRCARVPAVAGGVALSGQPVGGGAGRVLERRARREA
jgi:hypothetical protein